MSEDTFDYIIVGAGAGGATLAYELSRQTNKTILVLESGGPDLDPMIHIPKGFFFLYGGKKHSFYYQTKPVQYTGQAEMWQRGRVDGGSTSINGMQYDRAGQHYWDSVSEMTDDRWSWEQMLPTFRAIEDHELGSSPVRGAGGPLSITTSKDPEPLNEAIIEAAQSWGLPWADDMNEHDGERIAYMANTIKHGRRHSTARAFLSLARKKNTVTHLHHAHAVRVHFDGRRAVAVEAVVKDQRRLFRATEEIVLSAGPIESPMLLERSGIGQANVLRDLGVTEIVESPHVGEHAVEQRMFAYQWRIKEQMGYNQKLSTKLRQLVSGARYLMTRRGVIGTGGYDIGAFAKSDQQLMVPDLFLMFTPHMMDLTADAMAVAGEPGFSGAGYIVSPTTESSIHATSVDPFAPPIIDARYLEDGAERQATHRALEIVREIVAQHPLADLVEEEEAPGPDVRSLDDAVGHAWASGHLLHAVGTLRMGATDEAPVDPDLRVRGVEALRVADASVLPRQPGNAMAPTIGVGARAAQLIAG